MQDKFTVTLGKRLKELRKQNKLTQDKFSELLGIDSKHLSRIECGKTQPSLNLIKNAAKIFDMELFEIFETNHIDSKEGLIYKINDILNVTDLENLKIIYKITKEISTLR